MPKKLSPSLGLILLLLAGCDRLGNAWNDYQAQFVTPQGRVVDTGNGGISHSEGQGYGMLLAVAAGDRKGFETIWQWTRLQLQRRQDHLFIWRRRPGVPLSQEDFNNATDGDLLIAWALLEAADRWQREDWRREALAVAGDLKRIVIRSWQDMPVLLPGVEGFDKEDHLVLNLSYWVYPALVSLAEVDPDPVWGQLIDSGVQLTRQARFGPWQLPPDWLEAGKELKPWDERKPRFGYDAVRIPLYLIWAGRDGSELLGPFLRFWHSWKGYTPPWIDLEADCLGAYEAPAGIRAVSHLTHYAVGDAWWFHPPSPDNDYYSSTLVLLTRLAVAGRP